MKTRKAKALLLDKNIVGIEVAELFHDTYNNTSDVRQAIISTEVFLNVQKAQGKIYDYSVQQIDIDKINISIRLIPTVEIIQLRVTIL